MKATLLVLLTISLTQLTKSISLVPGVVDYSLDIEGNNITFNFNVSMLGWFSIGYGPGMINVDMTLAEIYGSKVVISDLWSTQEAQPVNDTTQSVTLLNSSVGSNSYQFAFTRLLNTSDNQDSKIVPGSTNQWCWAYSNQPRMTGQHSNAEIFSIVLPQSGSSFLTQDIQNDSFFMKYFVALSFLIIML